MTSTPLQDLLAVHGDTEFAHVGVKGMRWGVRRDERPLGNRDQALNVAQRSQVKVASTISALAAAGMTTNAAATLFQLQARIERYQVAKALLDKAENNPFIDDAGREAIRQTKNHIIKGIVSSAMATTAVTIAIGVVTQRTAKAYFAPVHKVYGDAKPKINSDLRRLSKDIKAGKRPSLTVKDYNKEVAKIVEKHMTADRKNLLSPFHELARQQLGTQYDTKKLSIKFEKLPNTDLYDKMTVVTPNGLKLVKAIKKVQHADLADDSEPVGNIDWYFDYKFDSEGYIEEWSCPTLEVANDILEGNFDMETISSKYGGTNFLPGNTPFEEQSIQQSDIVDDFLKHFGVPGMRWGVRRTVTQLKDALSKDSDPKNVDAPVFKGDKPTGSGITWDNRHYQSYDSTSRLSYTKYSDGTHDVYVRPRQGRFTSVLDTASGLVLDTATLAMNDKEEGMTSNALQDLLSIHGDKKLEHASGMTTAVCVVALPKQLDRVRLIGEEEKHATLLFLGEMSTLPNEARNELLQTLRQVSEIVAPFTERITKVERLGEETPPALVCKLRDNRLSQLRDMLLVNHRVKDYLDNTQQYPSYTPHVTLGYPDYAQEAELRKTTDGISGITFDRIALWWGNERLEFPLMEYSRLDEDVPMEKSAAWSEQAKDVLAHISAPAEAEPKATFSEAVSAFLAHFGVKGMRWGVRRSDAELTSNRKDKPARNVDTDGDGKSDARISADAERFMKTLEKPTAEMSDREIKEATARAQALQNYNKMFNQDQTQDPVAARAAELRNLREVKVLEAELGLTERSRVEKMKAAGETGWQAYKAIDGALGGKLTEGVAKKMGLTDPPSALDQLKGTNALLTQQKTKLGLEKDIASLTPKPPPPAPLPRGLSQVEKRAAVYSAAAKADVQSAKDLNRSLEVYLSNAKSTTNNFSAPVARGPNLPKRGTSAYGEMMVSRYGKNVSEGSALEKYLRSREEDGRSTSTK